MSHRGASGVPTFLCVELGHFTLTIWPLPRRVHGAACAGSASYCGLAFEDDARVFFTTAESLAQLQLSEPSSQRVDFDRSTSCFAVAGAEFFGVKTKGGPTG